MPQHYQKLPVCASITAVRKCCSTPETNLNYRRSETSKLRIDRSAVAREAKLDGKFLLRTSDESLTAADLAEGYKALYEAERGWRDLKHTIELRPAYHRREDRIEAHVQPCWLALLEFPRFSGHRRACVESAAKGWCPACRSPAHRTLRSSAARRCS